MGTVWCGEMTARSVVDSFSTDAFGWVHADLLPVCVLLEILVHHARVLLRVCEAQHKDHKHPSVVINAYSPSLYGCLQVKDCTVAGSDKGAVQIMLTAVKSWHPGVACAPAIPSGERPPGPVWMYILHDDLTEVVLGSALTAYTNDMALYHECDCDILLPFAVLMDNADPEKNAVARSLCNKSAMQLAQALRHKALEFTQQLEDACPGVNLDQPWKELKSLAESRCIRTDLLAGLVLLRICYSHWCKDAEQYASHGRGVPFKNSPPAERKFWGAILKRTLGQGLAMPCHR